MEKSANKMNVLSEDAGNVKREKVRVVPITAIDDAPNHPFQIIGEK